MDIVSKQEDPRYLCCRKKYSKEEREEIIRTEYPGSETLRYCTVNDIKRENMNPNFNLK